MCAKRKPLTYAPNKPTFTPEARAAAEKARQEMYHKQATPTRQEPEQTPIMPKYYLTNNVIEVDGRKLHQIVAARDIVSLGVQEGDLGGFVESERNLSHKGTCWIFAGQVYGQATVQDGATVRGEGVRVHDNAKLTGGFTAYDEVHLHGRFQGTGCGKAMGRVDASDNAVIMGSGCAAEGTIMKHRATISGNARASGGTILDGNVVLTGNFETFGGYYASGTLGRNPGEKGERPEKPDKADHTNDIR